MKYLDKIIELTKDYSPKVLSAILVLIIGYIIIWLFKKGLKKIFERKKIDPSVKSFLISLINITLIILLWISVLSMVGIKMTSFIALLGAAGLAIGMALTGTLQNFAGGVMILLFRPFKVGDFIDAQGQTGTVAEIQIFNTILKTPDNKTIIIPNAGLSSSTLTNYSTELQRRVDWTFGIGYGDDIDKAERIIRQLIESDERILKTPEPFIALAEMAESSVNLVVRVWVEGKDYWNVYFDMNRKVYDAFNAEGINIPYPQMDVHLHQ